MNKASSPADTLPNLPGNTQPAPATLDSIVRPELNQSDRDIDTLIGAWRHKVLDFERSYGFYDPWEENPACKPTSKGTGFYDLIFLVDYSAKVVKILGDHTSTATVNGKASASRYQQEIREKFPLYFNDGWQPPLPNLPNNPNDWLPTNPNSSDYYDLVR